MMPLIMLMLSNKIVSFSFTFAFQMSRVTALILPRVQRAHQNLNLVNQKPDAPIQNINCSRSPNDLYSDFQILMDNIFPKRNDFLKKKTRKRTKRSFSSSPSLQTIVRNNFYTKKYKSREMLCAPKGTTGRARGENLLRIMIWTNNVVR